MRVFSLVMGGMLLLISVIVVGAQDSSPTPFPEITYDEARVTAINLVDYPVLPELTAHARLIYERGQAAGQNPRTFAKVGDCMTDAAYFLFPFGQGDYDLGEYSSLQSVIDYYQAGNTRLENDEPVSPFATNSLAAESGFNTASILDPIWADPTWCAAGESPLACEYRLARPAFAFIMVGTNDVQFFDAVSFNFYTRQIIEETIRSNVVPVLYTFPLRPEFPEKTLLFNQIIISIALDYDLPLINLHIALEELPDFGVDMKQPTHVSLAADGKAGIFNDEYLQTGAALRNLLTLQTLERFQTALNGETETAAPGSGG